MAHTDQNQRRLLRIPSSRRLSSRQLGISTLLCFYFFVFGLSDSLHGLMSIPRRDDLELISGVVIEDHFQAGRFGSVYQLRLGSLRKWLYIDKEMGEVFETAIAATRGDEVSVLVDRSCMTDPVKKKEPCRFWAIDINGQPHRTLDSNRWHWATLHGLHLSFSIGCGVVGLRCLFRLLARLRARADVAGAA